MSTECTWGGGGWLVHESCPQAGQVPAGKTEGPKAPALQDEGRGRLPPPGLPRGGRRCLCAGPGLPEVVLVSLPAQEPRGGRAGAPAGAGGEQLPSCSRGLKNGPVGPERPRRGGTTSRLLVTGTGTGSGGQAAAPASRGRGRRPAGSARRWSCWAGRGQPVAALVAVAPRCLYEPMAGGPRWTRRGPGGSRPCPARAPRWLRASQLHLRHPPPAESRFRRRASGFRRAGHAGPGSRSPPVLLPRLGPGVPRDGPGCAGACLRPHTRRAAWNGRDTTKAWVLYLPAPPEAAVLKCGGYPGTYWRQVPWARNHSAGIIWSKMKEIYEFSETFSIRRKTAGKKIKGNKEIEWGERGSSKSRWSAVPESPGLPHRPKARRALREPGSEQLPNSNGDDSPMRNCIG